MGLERGRYLFSISFNSVFIVSKKVLFLMNLILLLGCQHIFMTQWLEAREAGKSPFPPSFSCYLVFMMVMMMTMMMTMMMMMMMMTTTTTTTMMMMMMMMMMLRRGGGGCVISFPDFLAHGVVIGYRRPRDTWDCLSLRLKHTVPLWTLAWSNKSLLLLLCQGEFVTLLCNAILVCQAMVVLGTSIGGCWASSGRPASCLQQHHSMENHVGMFCRGRSCSE